MNKILIIGLLLAVLASVVVICLGIGPTGVSYKYLRGFCSTTEETEAKIVYEVRLPRILGAVLVGLGLAVAGAVLQAILRNPLAEPYTLGISGGAVLGVALCMIVPFLSAASFSWPIMAFIGALVSVIIVYVITSRHHFSVSSLILSGVVLSFICSSLVLLIFSVSKPTEIQSVLFFLMGSFATIDYPIIKVITTPLIAGVLILVFFSRDIDVLTLGDEKASHLGISPHRIRAFLFVITSLITGCCVAVSGMVGFVGLMIPHIMRSIVGPQSRGLFIASALSGAIFLVVSDTLARTVIAPAELPVGVITGIVGGVFFIGMLINAKNI
ncbi:MAG: iron ABC transporter permease [Planctomycetes bacterium]|nr:iron ABC transporter permease [Planctomycetota bacterium]